MREINDVISERYLSNDVIMDKSIENLRGHLLSIMADSAFIDSKPNHMSLILRIDILYKYFIVHFQ